KASRYIPTQIHESLEENLNTDVDPKEWNWQAMAGAMNARFGLKTNDRELKKIGRDALAEHLIDLAEKSMAEIDLTGGRQYLEMDWGVKSVCDWARLKFQIKLEPQQLRELSPAQVKALLHDQVMALYRQKEIEFPVTL